MATEVTLPALGESVTEGTVTRWLKQVGDAVAVDEPLLEVSTDKVDTEIPSPVAGTLLEIKANEDDTVEVGAVLARDRRRGRVRRRVVRRGVGPVGRGRRRGRGRHRRPRPRRRRRVPSGGAPGAGARAARARPSSPPPRSSSPVGRWRAVAATTSVTLPALGESVTEGTVTRWLKQVGDEVAVDEPLLEVSTDKVDTEIPSPVAGHPARDQGRGGRDRRGRRRARRRSATAGRRAASGESEPRRPSRSRPSRAEPQEQPSPRRAEEQAAEAAARAGGRRAAGGPRAAARPRAQPAAPAQPAASAGRRGRDEPSGYVTPLVRKMAAQHGVDLAAVTGTGVGGRIRKQDVLDAAAAGHHGPPTAAAQAAAAPAARPGSRAAPHRPHRPPAARARVDDAVAAARHDREDDAGCAR